MKATPNFVSIYNKNSHMYDQIVSVPVWLQMTDTNMDDLVLSMMFI